MTLSERDGEGSRLICDSCGQRIANAGAWLRVRASITNTRSGNTRILLDCEACVREQHKHATLERLHRLGLAKGLSRGEQRAGQPVGQPSAKRRQT